jgi:hypothetical protein
MKARTDGNKHTQKKLGGDSLNLYCNYVEPPELTIWNQTAKLTANDENIISIYVRIKWVGLYTKKKSTVFRCVSTF